MNISILKSLKAYTVDVDGEKHYLVMAKVADSSLTDDFLRPLYSWGIIPRFTPLPPFNTEQPLLSNVAVVDPDQNGSRYLFSENDAQKLRDSVRSGALWGDDVFSSETTARSAKTVANSLKRCLQNSEPLDMKFASGKLCITLIDGDLETVTKTTKDFLAATRNTALRDVIALVSMEQSTCF